MGRGFSWIGRIQAGLSKDQRKMEHRFTQMTRLSTLRSRLLRRTGAKGYGAAPIAGFPLRYNKRTTLRLSSGQADC